MQNKTVLKIYNGEKINKYLPLKLLEELKDYKSKTKSTGCNPTDYCTLYKNIINNKFKEIYEAGTGISTLVMAHALHVLYEITGVKGRVTSMEEHPEYLDMSKKLLPSYLQEYVDFVLSDRYFDSYMMFCGYRYKDVPKRQYDFGWFDGPSMLSGTTSGGRTANFDAVYLCVNRRLDVWGFVDGRVYTVFVLKEMFDKKIRYYIDPKDYKCKLGIINGIKFKDLKDYKTKVFYNVKKLITDGQLM